MVWMIKYFLFFLINLLLLIIIWSIDLPINESYPFLVVKIKKNFIQTLNIKNIDERVFADWYLIQLEFNYLLSVGLYEYFIYLKLLEINKHLSLIRWIWFNFCIIALAIYNWWVNIGFIVGSILLPITAYYFFLLMDYYEVMEEFMQIINEKLKNQNS